MVERDDVPPAETGIACPRCAGRQWEVIETRWCNAGKRRWRVCRACKQRIDTIEVYVPRGHLVQVVPKEESHGSI